MKEWRGGKGERIKRCLPPRRPCNLSKYNCILTNFKCILDAPSRIKFRESYAGVLFLLKGYLLKIKPFEWVPEVKAGTHRPCHQPFPRPSCTYNIPEVAHRKLRNVFSFPYIHCPHLLCASFGVDTRHLSLTSFLGHSVFQGTSVI